MRNDLDHRWNDAVHGLPLPLALRRQQLGPKREAVRASTLVWATLLLVTYVLSWLTVLEP